MHVSDGILSVKLSVALDCLAVAGIYYSAGKLKTDKIPAAGIMTAMMFVLSSIHFPVGSFSFHLTFAGLAGVLLGAGSITVIFICLLFQALFLQHGGVVSIGTNLLVIGSGCIAGAACIKYIKNRKFAGFAGGFAGVAVPVLILGTLFHFSGYGRGYLYLMSIYVVPAAVEGLLTLTVIRFLDKTAPELMK